MELLPDAPAVLRHLGSAGAGVTRLEAERCVRRAALLVRTYTHGRGFDEPGKEVDSELALVIVSSAARALINPAVSLRMSEELLSAMPGSFADWSEGEAGVLDRFS